MAVELEGIQFKVEGVSGSNSADDIKQLASALESLKGSLPSTGKIKNAILSLQRLSVATSKLKFDSTSISNLGNALSSFSGAKVSSTIGDNIRNIGDAARTITDADVARIRELSDALSGLQGIGNIRVNTPRTSTVAGGTAPIGAMDAETMDEEVVDAREEISHAQGSFRSFFSNVSSGFSNLKSQVSGFFMSIASGFSGEGKEIATLFQSIDENANKASTSVKVFGLSLGLVGRATKKLMGIPAFFGKHLAGGIQKAVGKLGSLFAGLQRIAMYRAMRTVIKWFTQGLSEGLKNLYGYSQLVGTSFASSMDRLATSALYLKNSLGAVAAPFIEAIAPAVDFVTDKFVDLLNTVNMFIARLTGKSTATIAKKTFTQWGDDADKSAKKTKKATEDLKRTIFGFDEINRLEDANKDKGTSGSGTGTTPTDYKSMFEQVPIDSEIGGIADKLKSLFQDKKWAELGTYLGELFNDMIDRIPWEDIGDLIGEGIDGAITIAYNFLKTVSFVKLGKKVASLFNHALTKIDTEKLGRLLVRALTCLADLLIGAITKVNWGLVAEKASDFIIGVFEELSDWIDGVDWVELTKSLYKNIKEFIKKVKWSKIAQSICKFLGTAVGAIASVLITIGKEIATDIFDGIKEKYFKAKSWLEDNVIAPIKKGVEEGNVVSGLFQAGYNIVTTVWDGIKSVGVKIYDLFIKPIVDGFKSTFGSGNKSSNPELDKCGEDIWDSIAAGIIKAALGKFAGLWAIIKGLFEHPDQGKTGSIGLEIQPTVTEYKEKPGIKRIWEGVVSTIANWNNKAKKSNLPWEDRTVTVGNWFNNAAASLLPWNNRTATITGWDNTVAVGKNPWENQTATVAKWSNNAGEGKSPWENVKSTVAKWLNLTPDGKNPWENRTATLSNWNNIAKVQPWENRTASVSRWNNIAGVGNSPWENRTATVSKWSNIAGAGQSAWEMVKATIASWTNVAPESKTPWLGVKSKIGQWIDNASKKPWVDVVSTIKTWSQTNTAINAQPWSDVVPTVLGWDMTTTGRNYRPWLDVNVSIYSWSKSRSFSWPWQNVTVTYSSSSNRARGGAYSSGHWHNIPQYESGGIPTHGTMFVAGEAGAEVVGHINGRTEVLNASQLASAIHSAVLSAMQQANGNQNPMFNITVRTEDNEVLARAVTRGQRSLDARLNATAAY